MRPVVPTRGLRITQVALLVFFTSCTAAHDDVSATPAWLTRRADSERAAAAGNKAIHDFLFRDQTAGSGITFVDQIVDDAAKNYKAVHYDHGTGTCAADVDGDGRTDLFFVSQRGSSELYHNDGGGRFSNTTDAAGLRTTDIIAIGCAFGDIDNDGRPDLFVSTVRHGNRLYHNMGGGKFTDISAAAGVDYSGHSSGALFFDYDNDGLLDLFVANIGIYTSDAKGPGDYYVGLPDAFHGHTHLDRAEASILYHNDGNGKFTNASQQSGLVDYGWSGDAVVIDVNGDGFPDLYALNMQGDNHLWLNEGGKHFRDATATYFPKTPWGAMGAKAFDANGDGKLDVLVTDMHSDMFTEIGPTDERGERTKSNWRLMPMEIFPNGMEHALFGNALYMNNNDAPNSYREASGSMGVETYWPWGPTVADFNADGWDDIFITAGMSFPFRYQPNELLLNNAGQHFVPSAFTLGVEPRTNGATEKKWFSLDCNGADSNHLYCKICNDTIGKSKGCRPEGGNKYTVMGTLSTRSAVAFDIDGDGDLDLVSHEFNAAPRVLVSDLAARHPVQWLSVRLHGTRANRSGIGAAVTVVLANGQRQMKMMDGKSGYLSFSDMPLYFGLGAADVVSSVEVRWPGGHRQVTPGPIKSRQTLEIAER